MYEEEEIYRMEIELLKSLRWKLVYPNLADLLKILVISFVDDPLENTIIDIEQFLDFCISSKQLKMNLI